MAALLPLQPPVAPPLQLPPLPPLPAAPPPAPVAPPPPGLEALSSPGAAALAPLPQHLREQDVARLRADFEVFLENSDTRTRTLTKQQRADLFSRYLRWRYVGAVP
jgi:hypothetical protein